MATQQAPQTQRPNLLNPEFEYVPHTKTDVQATWRRFGWEPPCPRRQQAMRAKLNKMN